MTSDYEKAIDALTKDVKDLRADMKGIISALHGKAGDYVDNAKECLHDTVANRPFASLLTAVGVGMILSSLLRWHRR